MSLGEQNEYFKYVGHDTKKPGMFLGSNSITALHHFIDGYQFAERELGVCREGELFPLPFEYMHEYTGYCLKCYDNLGWCDQILRSCNGDEEAALWKFYEIYKDFVQIRMNRYWKAVLSEDNIAWNNCMEHAYTMRPKRKEDSSFVRNEDSKEPIYKALQSVYVIELTIPVYILAVETADDIRLSRRFFMSIEEAKGNQCTPEGAEVYFGPIDSWQEFVPHSTKTYSEIPTVDCRQDASIDCAAANSDDQQYSGSNMAFGKKIMV